MFCATRFWTWVGLDEPFPAGRADTISWVNNISIARFPEIEVLCVVCDANISTILCANLWWTQVPPYLYKGCPTTPSAWHQSEGGRAMWSALAPPVQSQCWRVQRRLRVFCCLWVSVRRRRQSICEELFFIPRCVYFARVESIDLAPNNRNMYNKNCDCYSRENLHEIGPNQTNAKSAPSTNSAT